MNMAVDGAHEGSTRREDCSSTLGLEEPGLALAAIPPEGLPGTEPAVSGYSFGGPHLVSSTRT